MCAPKRYTARTSKARSAAGSLPEPCLIFFRQLFRCGHVIVVILLGVLELLIKRPRSRPERAAWLTKLCRAITRAAHISWSVEGPIPTHGAVITNHLNYTDILVHAAIRPCVFVSKIEVRSTPVIGWVSMMAGTLYVQRGAGGSSEKAAQGMAKGFRDGLPIVFFPEGTTSTGEAKLLPFRTGLLAQTIMAEEPITAGFLHYELSEADLQRGCSTRHDIHWGPQPFVSHLWKQLGIGSMHCKVRFASDPIHFSASAVEDRKIAAVEAREAVLALYEPMQSDRSPHEAPK